ncbi:Peptidyl-prolyl cis-trans isomerase PpiB [Marinobacterium lacunae]|uniref:Peptidyl-prolyl cis-trans isomerase n=1 Tax=Marinobacterium lacunae TaxID=1232683 RepID=A0A081FZQ0_9GAMM|nr:peptidylprolyl isomerase [Marinobacterium lacunae]KEA64005.1 Peptidyl-prolyl cis-trans isomerase PpiB [Marinobacterium lacunae]
MRKLLAKVAACLVVLASVSANAETVRLTTSMGTIELELLSAEAPKSTENFLGYVQSGYYDGMIFHRVIPGFMIQGGGMDENFKPRSTRPPVANESDNGLSNMRGTVAMARTRNPNSATSQFFINTVNNVNLDGRPGQPGYTVFGRVTSGMDVVDRISAVETTSKPPFRDVPVTPIVIERAEVIPSAQ